MSKNRFNRQQPGQSGSVSQPESTRTNADMADQQNANQDVKENTNQEAIQNTGVEGSKEAETQNTESVASEQTSNASSEPQVATGEVNKTVANSKTEKEGFVPVYKVELELTQYAEHMDPTKPIDPIEGGKWQYSLFTLVKSILNATSQEVFVKEWNTLLNFFNKNKEGIFNDNFIFRFPEQWPGSANEFTQFRRIIYTIVHTADPKTRKKNLADISIETVTEGLTQDQRNKFISFYG